MGWDDLHARPNRVGIAREVNLKANESDKKRSQIDHLVGKAAVLDHKLTIERTAQKMEEAMAKHRKNKVASMEEELEFIRLELLDIRVNG